MGSIKLKLLTIAVLNIGRYLNNRNHNYNQSKNSSIVYPRSHNNNIKSNIVIYSNENHELLTKSWSVKLVIRHEYF